MDAGGNLLVFGNTYSSVATPGAYTSPPSSSSCLFYNQEQGPYGLNGFLLKLSAKTLQPIFEARLSASCGITTGSMEMDASGAAVLAISSGSGLALLNPLVAGSGCAYNAGAIVKISADGSTLQFATYLDSCGIPGMAIAPNGSIYAGVSPSSLYRVWHAAAVLNIVPTNTSAISLNQISNAFSGDSTGVTVGGLYTLTGQGFQPSSTDLGTNPAESLPTQLEGVRVFFDDEPAAILSVAPGRVIVAAPEVLIRFPRKSGSVSPKFTAVQLAYNGSLSSPVWMPVSASLPGLLTSGLLNPQPSSTLADGYVQNQNGTLNTANNPAAVGSTIKLLVTGMGATSHRVVSGSIAQSTAISPDAVVYPTWQYFSFRGPNLPSPVYSIPGFLSSMFQILLEVPASAETIGQSVGNGVQLVPVGLQLELTDSEYYDVPTGVEFDWNLCEIKISKRSVFRRPLHMIDDDGADGGSDRHQFQPQLLAHRLQKTQSERVGLSRGIRIGWRWTRWTASPLNDVIERPTKSRSVHHRFIDLPGHGPVALNGISQKRHGRISVSPHGRAAALV